MFVVHCLCRLYVNLSCHLVGSIDADLFCTHRLGPCRLVFWGFRLVDWRNWAGCHPKRSSPCLEILKFLTMVPNSRSKISIFSLFYASRPVLLLASASMLARVFGFRCSRRFRLVLFLVFLLSEGFQIWRLCLTSFFDLSSSSLYLLHASKSVSSVPPACFKSSIQIIWLRSSPWR